MKYFLTAMFFLTLIVSAWAGDYTLDCEYGCVGGEPSVSIQILKNKGSGQEYIIATWGSGIAIYPIVPSGVDLSNSNILINQSQAQAVWDTLQRIAEPGIDHTKELHKLTE